MIQRFIELTRFPIPGIVFFKVLNTKFTKKDDKDHKDTQDYPGLIRAADLLGQLSDPRLIILKIFILIRYLQKIPALFYEFKETGAAERFGYKSPGDILKNYSKFYWKVGMYFQFSYKSLSLCSNCNRIFTSNSRRKTTFSKFICKCIHYRT